MFVYQKAALDENVQLGEFWLTLIIFKILVCFFLLFFYCDDWFDRRLQYLKLLLVF